MAEETQKTEFQEFIEENKPTGSEQTALLHAYCKVHFGTTQEAYSKELGFSSRLLRTYISEHRELYDQELKTQEEIKAPEYDPTSLNRSMTEEQLDKFVQNLIEQAIRPDASVRQQQLLIDFTGMSSNEVMNLQAMKQRSLRWFIKNELGSISKYLDTRDLGVMLNESTLLDLGTVETKGSRQKFVDTTISDEGLKLEALYYGMLFMSLYNQVEHPDLKLMQEALRLDRIERGTARPLNKREVRLYAKGKNVQKKERLKLSDAELVKKLSVVFDKKEAKEIVKNRGTALKPTATPEVDPVEVKAGVSKHDKELQVILDTQEEISKMLLAETNSKD
ncbi:hypothetical protein [Salinicoccus carnicancri]|uniref:hypothetical protein n=1 Tax=Salinicoccus carnicancri TaxID=558170 RepID=UPI0003052D92|nr:hypothetical protein [Salinicoccus carnicancri]